MSYSNSLIDRLVVMVVLKEAIIDYCACYMPLIKDCITSTFTSYTSVIDVGDEKEMKIIVNYRNEFSST